jgi:predicted nucleotidyltransferase
MNIDSNQFDPENPNLARLTSAAKKLEPLLGQIVFVGGCVTGLLLTDPAAAPVRPTLDVDAIVAIGSYADFTLLENQMSDLGFHESHAEGAPICRWISGDLILDLMPTDASILGFGNRWYHPALENAQRAQIGEYEIRLITAPYFLATKLEAFHGRGRNDFRMSHDLEDIVTVVDGRPEITEEVHDAPADLQRYLGDEFRALLSNRDFLEALPGHLLPDSASQQRLGLVMNRMQQFLVESY